VVTTLGLLLKLDEMNLPHFGKARPTENLEAFDDYLRGVESTSLGTQADSEKGRQWIEKAIALDPQYAEPYAQLGWILMLSAWNQWSTNPLADLKHATESGQKALTLDDTNSTALALLCESDWMQLRYDQAVADGERAVAINPNYAGGFFSLSDALNVYSRPDAAIRAAQKAIRLDPTGKDLYSYDIGVAYVEMGRYEDAVPILKESLTAFPHILISHECLIAAYVELGRDEDARAEAKEILRMSPQFTLASVPAPGRAFGKLMQDDLVKAGLK
jgi:adenylate cyclase